jgi:23S rRNA (adenine2503-C2)-methyltransferase
MPVAGRIPLDDLADAIRAHDAASPGRQTVAWILLSGINTGPEEVEAMQRLLEGVRLRINILDYNEIEGAGYRRASRPELDRFVDALQALKVPVVRRYSGGSSCEAACGMLQGRRTAAHGDGDD